MPQPQVITNAFEPKQLNQLLRKFQFVAFEQSAEKVMKELEEVTSDQYLWAVCRNPAYFLQYQIKSVAVVKVKKHVLLVWKPKYIEYPAINQLPPLKEKKPHNLNIEYLPGTTTTQETNGLLTTFLQSFYVTFFHSDPQFQTKLITNIKHLISSISKHSYWHVILDDTDSVYVTKMSKMMNVCKIRISGMKEGYDKTLMMFAYQGKRNDFFRTAKNKWMQLVSFIAMGVIFYSITACSADNNEGICAYRQEMSMLGTATMLTLIGLRYVKDKKKNKGNKKPNPELKRD